MKYNIPEWIDRGQKLASNILLGKFSEAKKGNNFKFIDDLTEVNKLRDSYAEYCIIKAKYSFDNTSQKSRKQSTLYKLSFWNYAAVAAVLVAVFFAALYPYYFTSTIQSAHPIQKVGAPNNQKAYIKLSDGRIIALNQETTLFDNVQGSFTHNVEGKLVIGPGSVTNAIVRHHIFVPHGAEYSLILSDGTKVWLNAGSELEFPSSFEGVPNRVVQLKGEGYFEIASNKKQPFYVESGPHRVLATGTAFNISAYLNDANYIVTLLEGGVAIQDDMKSTAELLPNQEYVYQKGSSSYKTRQVLAKNRIAWVNGQFIFQREPLTEILKKIERWYDVDVVLKGDVLPTYNFTGVISRNISIKEFLETLKMTNEIDYNIVNRQITIFQKK